MDPRSENINPEFKKALDDSLNDREFIEGHLSRRYDYWLENLETGNHDKVLTFVSEYTGIRPSEEAIMKTYNKSIDWFMGRSEESRVRDQNIRTICHIARTTGVQPPEQGLREIVSEGLIVEHYSSSDFRWLKELREAGIELPEDLIQAGYTQNIIHADNMIALLGATTIKPSEETVQKAYFGFLSQDSYIKFENLRDATGIEPLDKVLYGGIINLIQHKD